MSKTKGIKKRVPQAQYFQQNANDAFGKEF